MNLRLTAGQLPQRNTDTQAFERRAERLTEQLSTGHHLEGLQPNHQNPLAQ